MNNDETQKGQEDAFKAIADFNRAMARIPKDVLNDVVEAAARLNAGVEAGRLLDRVMFSPPSRTRDGLSAVLKLNRLVQDFKSVLQTAHTLGTITDAPAPPRAAGEGFVVQSHRAAYAAAGETIAGIAHGVEAHALIVQMLGECDPAGKPVDDMENVRANVKVLRFAVKALLKSAIDPR